jgi:hypothetical protein
MTGTTGNEYPAANSQLYDGKIVDALAVGGWLLFLQGSQTHP